MSEHALWVWLKDRLPVTCHASRIESETSPGFPDVHYTWEGKTGSIELKKSRFPSAKCPFRTGGMRQSQIDWIKEEFSAGGFVFLLVQVKNRRFLLHGSYAQDLNKMSLKAIQSSAMEVFTGHDAEIDSYRLRFHLK